MGVWAAFARFSCSKQNVKFISGDDDDDGGGGFGCYFNGFKY
jgi:hypothetical protein